MKENSRSLRDEDRHLRLLLIAKRGLMLKKGKKAQTALGGRNSKKGIRDARRSAQQDDRRQNVLGDTADTGNLLPELPEQERPAEETVDPSIAQALPATGPERAGLPMEQPSSPAEKEASYYEETQKKSYEDYF